MHTRRNAHTLPNSHPHPEKTKSDQSRFSAKFLITHKLVDVLSRLEAARKLGVRHTVMRYLPITRQPHVTPKRQSACVHVRRSMHVCAHACTSYCARARLQKMGCRIHRQSRANVCQHAACWCISKNTHTSRTNERAQVRAGETE